MKTKIGAARGAASIIVELSDGKVRVLHGTDKVLLYPAVTIREGGWSRIFEAVRTAIHAEELK